MGRGEGSESIRKHIRMLRERIPGVTIRTTFIVGFPGETESDFEELMAFIQETRFDRMGAFIFSPEEGTEAHDFRPSISPSTAKNRYKTLMEVQQEICKQMNREMESRKVPVLVDGYDDVQNLFFGRSEGDALDVDQTVWIKGSADLGKIVPVTIEASSAYDLLGCVSDSG